MSLFSYSPILSSYHLLVLLSAYSPCNHSIANSIAYYQRRNRSRWLVFAQGTNDERLRELDKVEIKSKLKQTSVIDQGLPLRALPRCGSFAVFVVFMHFTKARIVSSKRRKHSHLSCLELTLADWPNANNAAR